MNRIVISAEREKFFTPKNTKRGAKVYGIPMSKELASYIDDVTPDAQLQRMLNMFFAGKGIPVGIEEDSEGEF